MGVTKVFINSDAIHDKEYAGVAGVLHFGGVITTPPTFHSDTVLVIKMAE